LEEQKEVLQGQYDVIVIEKGSMANEMDELKEKSRREEEELAVMKTQLEERTKEVNSSSTLPVFDVNHGYLLAIRLLA